MEFENWFILYGISLVGTVTVCWIMFVVKTQIRFWAFQKKQTIIAQQDLLQYNLGRMGLRETMEFQRASFKHRDMYSEYHRIEFGV